MLEARNITFGYGGTPLFIRLSLSCDKGERIALSAPSGFGKTTLCQLLAGYLAPQAGDVLIDGSPLPREGVCPVQLIGQNPAGVLDERRRLGDSLAEAYDGLRAWRTMREFGGKGAQGMPQPVEDLLEAMEIRPVWFHRFPHELSGGELQRFCIARALLACPRYLIADEITTMLDAVSAARIWRVILAYLEAQYAGIVLVSHEPALVDRIATRTVDLTRQSPKGRN